MRYINFEMSGERVRSKLLTYCSTRFPDCSIYSNDVFSGFQFRNLRGEMHILILFNHEGDENKALVNLGFAEIHADFRLVNRIDDLFLFKEYRTFEEWCETWQITIDNKSHGVRPQFIIDSNAKKS